MRVNGGSDRTRQGMPHPDAHDFAGYAALFAAADICMAQFVNVVIGQYPFDGRGDRPCVGGARLFKVDKRQNFLYHRRKGRTPQYDVLPQPLLARFDLQPLAVYNAHGRKFALPHAEVKER